MARTIPNVPSTSPFGDVVGTDLHPYISLKGTYGLTDDHQVLTGFGGSASVVDAEYVLESGTTLYGYANVWSRQPIVYRAGIGCEARVTGRFSTPLALSQQLCGLYSAADGMFAGYNGTRFGVMHRYGGEFHIVTLTVTVAASGAETATLTLNGTAYTFAVTAGTTAHNAHEVEAGIAAGAAGTYWYAQHIGSTVKIVFKGAGAKSGAYTLTSTGTLAGTFATVNTGVAPTENWYYQEDWSNDKGGWFNAAKGNLFRFEFAYLGYGPLKWYIFHQDLLTWILVHTVKWSNYNVGTNFGNPSLRVGWAVGSVGSSGTNVVMRGASGMAALQGKDSSPDRIFSAIANNASVSTETQILSVKVRYDFGSRFSNCIVLPSLNVATDSTKGMIFRVYLNTTVAGTTTHDYIDVNQSVCIYDTAGTTVSGGRILGAYVVGPSGSRAVSASDLGIVLAAGDELTITGQVTSGAASGGFVTANLKEVI